MQAALAESETESNLLRVEADCPLCGGLGKLNRPGAPDCPRCGGTGAAEEIPDHYAPGPAPLTCGDR
ncbi:MAG TPA: hypothetical protein VLS90_16420 [Thermodesulfobacteriota bacterium]|nr:hypothetical protein [Thermodesulfobacteriota bacterium]